MATSGTFVRLAACGLVAFPTSAAEFGACPFASQTQLSTPKDTMMASYDGCTAPTGADFSSQTYNGLEKDIVKMFTDSQEFWPADFGNYAPLMIRLAWHCAGSYRMSDGRGGCDGSRIRYNPEFSWADNTNLDKALELLQPIKLKYGDLVSWGDLIAFTGTTAIKSMGGPVLGFCGGRRDDASGYDSLELGPTAEQEAVAPCAVNGTCESPLGTSTVGLIYVNPGGPMGEPDPAASVDDIRDVFGRMGMDDRETVALIGGGHAFGKTHGACPTGPGPNPMDDPANPYPGTCGDPSDPDFGKGENTYTSGFELQWTPTPTKWSNSYFEDLLEYDWVLETGPGEMNQWRPVLKPDAEETEVPDIGMLTSDIALIRDATYLALVEEYAEDIKSLEHDFSYAWYKLMSRDMGPVERCLGPNVPPAQDFQHPLPESSSEASQSDYDLARHRISSLMNEDKGYAKVFGTQESYEALFVTLAWRCASTFRATDYAGGCNGAKLRFSPQKDWAVNQGMDEVLALLEPVKTEYPDISYADLIVMAGTIAIERAGGMDEMSFCPGRVDATSDDADIAAVLEPREYDDVIAGVRDGMKIMGVSVRQGVALAGRLRSHEHQMLLGYSGSYTKDASILSNEFYNTLLAKTWEEVDGSGGAEYRATGTKDVYVLETDLALVWDPEMKAVAEEYAGNNDIFLAEFASAWTALMNADRFDGPFGNLCSCQDV